MPTVKDIVILYLKEHGYDGLYVQGECACRLGNLMPCDGEMGCGTGVTECQAGYLTDPPDNPEYTDCDFYIGAQKRKK